MSNRNICDTLNQDYWIRVLFHGLMTGCFRDARCYEVGILKNSPPTHTLRLSVWEKSAQQVQLVRDPFTIKNGLNQNSIIRLDVKCPAPGNDKVCCYQKSGPFDRHDPSIDRNDFRWSTDFENNEFFRRKLEKRSGDLTPKFRIENSGTLFTLVRSVPLIIERGRRIRVLRQGSPNHGRAHSTCGVCRVDHIGHNKDSA